MKGWSKNLSNIHYGMNPDIKIMITARTARNNVLVLLSISRRGLSSFSDGPKTSLSSEPKMREKKILEIQPHTL